MKKYFLVFRDPGVNDNTGGGDQNDAKTLSEENAGSSPNGANPPTGQVTDTQIAEWKAKFREGIYFVEIKDKIAYFQNPTLKHMNGAMAFITKDNPLDYFITIGRDTCIGGCTDIFEQTQYQQDFIETIKEKLEGKKGKLVNL